MPTVVEGCEMEDCTNYKDGLCKLDKITISSDFECSNFEEADLEDE